jgi:hypothetical protein
VKMSDEKALEPMKQTVAMTSSGVQLTTMDDAWRFATAIAGTDLAPKGMSANEVFGVVQAGAELMLPPLRSLANMKIINGRVGPMGALAKALVRQAKVLAPGTGFKQWFTGTEMEDDWTANITTRRADEEEIRTTSFSVKDAKRAKLWGKVGKGGPGPWVTYPQRMLMYRALGFHLDDNFSEILMGFHIAEVLPDYPAMEVVHAVMEPLDTPAVDPLLAKVETMPDPEQELAEVAAELQPPADEFKEDSEARMTATEVLSHTSPLSAVMAEKQAEAEAKPMTEAEATADLIREGLLTVKDEDLDDPDPENAAPEGEEVDLFA